MYTAEDLLDLHERQHWGTVALLDFCRPFSAEQLGSPIPGSGGEWTILLQFDHIVGTELYWIGVLRGEMLVEDDPATCTDLDAVEAHRKEVAEITRQYIGGLSTEELHTPREMHVWPDTLRTLIPARVFMRQFTHVFHHRGQIAAMCRALGRPLDISVDFPML